MTVPTDFYFIRFAAFGFFYFWGYYSFGNSSSLKKTFRALAFVWLITFYWYAMAKITHHIFLNQVQLFRIEWFYTVTIFPLITISFYRLFVSKFRKHKPLSCSDYFLFVVALLIWIDSLFVDCLIVYLFVRAKGFRMKCVDNRIFHSCIYILLMLIGVLELCRFFSIPLLDEYQIKEFVRLFGFAGVVMVGGMCFF